jgi:hypothetical protein
MKEKDLYYFFNKTHRDSIKKILDYSPKNKLLNCIALNGKIKYIPDEQETSIKEMISTIDPKSDNEVELRLGIIGKGFNPHISREDFIAYLNIARRINFVENIEDFVDLYNDYPEGKIRTRHKYSKEFEKYIVLDSINKQRILNVDVNLKNLAGFDVRFSRSSEKISDIYNLNGDGNRKYRITYTHPGNLYRIDFTAISDVSFIDRMYTQKPDSKETFQIEVELLSKDLDLQELLTILLKIFSKR